MLKKVKFALRCVVFLAILAICLGGLSRVLIPKFLYDEKWPTTSTYVDFYKQDKNSTDVLFLGSSRAVCSFSPQQLYNEKGIVSYNLACEQQNLVVSYYWLKEALRFQKPKAVVLDAFLLFPFKNSEALNSTEGCTRKAMDYMKWSPVKKEAVSAICTLDPTQTEISYYFPHIRYHGRWQDLERNDFIFREMVENEGLYGFTPITKKSKYKDFKPFEAGSSDKKEKMEPVMQEYFEKIISLCKEEGIELVLVMTPALEAGIGKYNVVAEYAKNNGLSYYDFNEKGLYEKTEFDFARDMIDEGHTNIYGAVKMTSFMGDVLREKGIASRVSEKMEASRVSYSMIEQTARLVEETDIYKYLEMIDNDRYSVFISVKDEASEAFTPELAKAFAKLGLKTDLTGKFRYSYCAAVTEDGVEEALGKEAQVLNGLMDKQRTSYVINSGGRLGGGECSIMIDGEDYARDKRGVNIVVYDNVSKKIVDTVAFDTHDKELSVSR